MPAIKREKMRKLLLSVLVGVSVFASKGQSTEMAPGDSIPWELRKQSFIYNTATLFNDPVVARMSLYNLLAENPANVPLYDSLALLYYQYNQNASAALVAQQALLIDPSDLFAVEIAANSFESLGVKDKALSYFEKLHLANEDVNTLYKIAFLQYDLKRYTEAKTSLDIIINDAKAKESKVSFPTLDQKGQQVPLDVAAHRVLAMIEEASGNKKAAQEKYLSVLEMYPGFQLVQQQLRELSKEEE